MKQGWTSSLDKKYNSEIGVIIVTAWNCWNYVKQFKMELIIILLEQWSMLTLRYRKILELKIEIRK